MEPLIIKETSNTPEVTLNKNSNKFEITGTSVPENVMFFSKNPGNKDRFLINTTRNNFKFT